MIKTSFIILCTMLTTTTWASVGGNIGILDDRTYGSLEEPIYSAVAQFKSRHGKRAIVCTAGFISQNLVLTNRHCASDCDPVSACTIRFWNGKKYVETPINKIVSIGRGSAALDGNDWAIVRTNDPNPHFKSVAQKTTAGQVDRGGFGSMRVIKDNEVDALKQIFIECTEKYEAECKAKENAKETDFYSCIFIRFDDEIQKRGFKSVVNDANNFKIQKCSITSNHPQSSNMVATTCDSAGGDSGAPLLRGGVIVALNNSGPHTFFASSESVGATAVKTENFYSYVADAISNFGYVPSKPTNGNNSGANPNSKPPKQNNNSGVSGSNNNNGNSNNSHPTTPATPTNHGNSGTTSNNSNSNNTVSQPTPPTTPNNPSNSGTTSNNSNSTNNGNTGSQPTLNNGNGSDTQQATHEPVSSVTTDPEEISRILNEELMQLECD